MAYMNQETKARIAAQVKPILRKYGLKGTLSVRNHSTLVLKITSGKIDYISDYLRDGEDNWAARYRCIDVNVYHYRNHFSGLARESLVELVEAMNDGNHDNSDIQTDYFDVGWYTDIQIGHWTKPYQVV